MFRPYHRLFSVSTRTYYRNLSHPLIWKVDWTKVMGGYYAIVDPLGTGVVLHMSEKEYRGFIKTILRSDVSMVILASPFETQPSPELITAPNPDQNTPPKSFDLWFSGKMSMRSSLSKWLFGSKVVEDVMIEPTERNLWGLVVRWGSTLSLRVGFKLGRISIARALITMLGFLWKYRQSHGNLALVNLLKTSLLIINRFLGNQPVHSSFQFGVPMRMTRGGLPRWIPLPIRIGIRAKHIPMIRFICSFLYIYRVIKAPHDMTKALLGIIRPLPVRTDSYVSLIAQFEDYLHRVFVPSVGGIRSIPRTSGVPFVSAKAGPNCAPSVLGYSLDALSLFQDPTVLGNVYRMLTFHRDSELMSLLKEKISLYQRGERCNVQEVNKLRLAQKQKRLYSADSVSPYVHTTHSRLHALEEPAGKVRVIAIVDAFTQSALKPLHHDLFRLLDSLPMDGTSSQDDLITRLKKLMRESPGRIWGSLDISAATDSIPVELYQLVLDALYGDKQYSEGVMALLVDRDFSLPHPDELPPEFHGKHKIRYGRGQPMGALSSFALLGILHHAIIGFAAFRTGITDFTNYGIVGDDITIMDNASQAGFNKPSRDIIDSYLYVWETFDVRIQLLKSFISVDFFNFLSRTFLGKSEISPWSVKEEIRRDGTSGALSNISRGISRGWVSIGSKGYLSSCLKMVLNYGQYNEFVSYIRSNCLSPLSGRILSGLFAPTQSSVRLAGLQRASFSAWFTALRCHAMLFDVLYRESYNAHAPLLFEANYHKVLVKINIELNRRWHKANTQFLHAGYTRSTYAQSLDPWLANILSPWMLDIKPLSPSGVEAPLLLTKNDPPGAITTITEPKLGYPHIEPKVGATILIDSDLPIKVREIKTAENCIATFCDLLCDLNPLPVMDQDHLFWSKDEPDRVKTRAEFIDELNMVASRAFTEVLSELERKPSNVLVSSAFPAVSNEEAQTRTPSINTESIGNDMTDLISQVAEVLRFARGHRERARFIAKR